MSQSARRFVSMEDIKAEAKACDPSLDTSKLILDWVHDGSEMEDDELAELLTGQYGRDLRAGDPTRSRHLKYLNGVEQRTKFVRINKGRYDRGISR